MRTRVTQTRPNASDVSKRPRERFALAAYTDGFAAHDDGVPMAHCPYDIADQAMLYQCWRDGWQDARYAERAIGTRRRRRRGVGRTGETDDSAPDGPAFVGVARPERGGALAGIAERRSGGALSPLAAAIRARLLLRLSALGIAAAHVTISTRRDDAGFLAVSARVDPRAAALAGARATAETLRTDPDSYGLTREGSCVANRVVDALLADLQAWRDE